MTSPVRSERGAGLLDVLIAVVVIGTCIAALAGQVLAVSAGARRAAVEGRRAELAQRLADRVRSGLAPEATGSVSRPVGGEAYEASFTRRPDVATGALELSARPAGGGGTLALSAALPVP